MPEPLRWSTPGNTWNSGLVWGGTVPAPQKKRMNNTKAIIDFSNYVAAELGPVAQHIHEEITAHATVFATPTVSMASLATLLTDYNAKLAARASRATADALAFNESRDALETALSRLGNYVNDVAQGDPVTVEQSGFPSYSTGKTMDTSPPGAPNNVRVRHGELTGVLVVRYKAQRQPSTNEVQTNIGNPNTEADWKQAGMFQGQKAVITGLTPGTVVWIRVRTVGLRGVMGDWSDPAQIMVI